MDDYNPHRYDDLLDLPYPPVDAQTSLSMQSRAAQFAPFAALTGYEDIIDAARQQYLNESEQRHCGEDDL